MELKHLELNSAEGIVLRAQVLCAGAPPKAQWSLLEALRLKERVYRDPAELKSEVDAWVAEFHASADDDQEAQPDADGWIRVQESRKGKKRVVGDGESWGVFASTMQQVKKRRKRKKSQSYDDFYAFQVKQRKASAIECMADK